MSEYQSYHFQTVGRLLSAEERLEVGELSSHIDVSASEASVQYSYSGFKHDPIRVLGRYFDVLVYRASWGSQTLAFRFDEGAVDTEALKAYEVPDFISIDREGANVIVHVSFDENEASGWIDPEDPDPRSFAVFYEEIGRGDYRALFMMWLQALELFGEEEEEAVPVPDGLGLLHEVHEALIDLVGLDADLVEAAKAWSKPLAAGVEGFNASDHLGLLTEEERSDVLAGVFSGDPLRVRSVWERTLRQRVKEAGGFEAEETQAAVCFANLRESVKEIKAARERKCREEAERRRADYLGRLKRHEKEIFPAVEAWIATKTTTGYDAAMDLLLGLEDLANSRGSEAVAAFRTRVEEIAGKSPRLPSLQARFLAAGWKEQPPTSTFRELRQREEFSKRRAARREMNFALLRGPGG